MIQIRNDRRFNIHASAEIDGVRYPFFTDRSLWDRLGITEIDEPEAPADYDETTYRRNETDEAPFVEYVRRTDAEIEAIRRSRMPQVVTRFQARAALHLAGHLEAVEALMAHPDTPMMARLAWVDAQEFRRQSPTVLAMAQALGLTDVQLDELFTAAAQIEA